MTIATLHVSLGDVPTWLLVVVGGLAAFFAYRAFKAEERARQKLQTDVQNDRDRAMEASERQQADSVSAWLGLVDRDEVQRPSSGGWVPPLPVMSGNELAVLVQNSSNQPVYRCGITLVDRTSGAELGTDQVDVLPPGERIPRGIPPTIDSENRSTLGVTIDFRDAALRRWTREWTGELHRAD